MLEECVHQVADYRVARLGTGPIAQGVAEEVGGTYPKLIRFPGVLEALRVG